MRVALAGSTGLVGGEVLKILSAQPQIDKTYLVGRRAPAKLAPNVEAVLGPFSESLNLAPRRILAGLCCLGTTIKKAGSRRAFSQVDLEAVLHFARACQGAGAITFGVVSALGADAHSRVFYNRVKGEMEQALLTLNFPSLVIVRPSLLLGQRVENRPMEHVSIVVGKGVATLLVGPLKRYRPVAAERVAQILVQRVLASSSGQQIVENEFLF